MLNFDGNTINITIAFLSGIITFFASCFLPLAPVYIAYLSGVSLTHAKESKANRRIILNTSILFVIGFITVFVLLGATFTSFAKLISPHKQLIEKIGGLLFIILGLQISGLLRFHRLSRDFHFRIAGWLRDYRRIHALLVGVTFGLGWSPCVGPVLGVILLWASQQRTFGEGLLMLIFYGLGLGFPFIILGLGFEKYMPLLKRSKRFTNYLQLVSGLLVLIAGLLLFFGKLQYYALRLIYLLGLDALSV